LGGGIRTETVTITPAILKWIAEFDEFKGAWMAQPFDTLRLMTELVEWTQSNLERGELHKLIVIAVFVVVFLAIQPF